MISGAMEYALTSGLFAFGVAWTTAGNAAIINAAEPVLIALLAVILLREPFSTHLLLVLGCVTVGLLLVMSQDLRATGSPGAGDLIVLASALSGACYAIISARLVSQIDPLPLAAAQQAYGLAALLVLAAIAIGLDQRFALFALGDVGWRALSLAVFSGLFANAAAVWLHLHALRRMPASSFAIFLGMVPVFTLAGAYLLLNETISVAQLTGGALIVAGAIGASGKRKSQTSWVIKVAGVVKREPRC
jgi:drug/metabolite transporter (DMT)-like permease